MAIHAKENGLLIGGEIVDETASNWIFQAMNNKRHTVISKTDEKNKIFEGENSVHDAMAWQDSLRNKK